MPVENDAVAYRLEYLDEGPFWRFPMSFQRSILRNSTQIAKAKSRLPEEIEGIEDFLTYYISVTDNDPRLCAAMVNHLEMNKPGTFQFGFESVAAMRHEFGLHHDYYRHQFDAALKEDIGFVVKAYLVKPTARYRNEIMFRTKTKVLLETALSFNEFMRL